MAIRNDSITDIARDESGGPVISANLCEALLRLRPDLEGSMIEFGFSWASAIPAPTIDGLSSHAIQFERRDFDAIEDAYLLLLPANELERSVFVAMVDELRGSLNVADSREGEVTLSLYSKESGELVKARAELTPEWYRIADEGHMAGKFVILRGLLRRGRRMARLSDVSFFELLDGDDRPQGQPEEAGA